jgi:DNA-binding response OmpR family regulator
MSTVVASILNTSKLNGTDNGETSVRETVPPKRERVLIVDPDPGFRGSLARTLTAAGCEVLIAKTGRQAFALLRDWRNPIAWLYSRAVLDSLIDGWVLADEYHSNHPNRPVIIAAAEAGYSASGDIILKDPTPAAVGDAIRGAIRATSYAALTKTGEQQHAA